MKTVTERLLMATQAQIRYLMGKLIMMFLGALLGALARDRMGGLLAEILD